MKDGKGHLIPPGKEYYEEGHLHKKIHCKDCYEELSNHSGSHLREEIEDEVSDVGSMAVGAAFGLLGDDDSSSGFGDSGDSSGDSFDGGDGGGGGDSGDC